MAEFGYKLSSEEHHPSDLVRCASRAEQAGFSFASLSDHFHPWIDKQGHSPFAWNVAGAVAATTSDLKLITGVTCPTLRMHPVNVAQAAATTAAMMPGRFGLGLGSGENLNEHVTGLNWPPASQRLDMLEEAVSLIRRLWTGKMTTFRGEHFIVDNARLYTLPEDPPPIYVAASGPKAVALAGEHSDGIISLAPDADLLGRFDDAGGAGKPRYCEVTLCWNGNEDKAKDIVQEWWPLTGVKGQLMQELALPQHFEAATEVLSRDQATELVACGPDPDVHLEAIGKFVDAGYTHIWLHQIGPDQDGFIDFFEKELRPALT